MTGVLLETLLDPSDMVGARRWWTAAAEAGHSDARFNLGLLLADLDPPELGEARRWLTAADAGDDDAVAVLGQLPSGPGSDGGGAAWVLCGGLAGRGLSAAGAGW